MSKDKEVEHAKSYLDARRAAWKHLLAHRRSSATIGDWLRVRFDDPKILALIDEYQRQGPRSRCHNGLAESLAEEDGSMERLDELLQGFRSLRSSYAQGTVRKVERAKARALRHRNALVQGAGHIVESAIQAFRRHPMDIEDLRQYGYLGLVRAAERFDHKRGIRFQSYCQFWVRHGVSRAVADFSRTIRIPVHLHQAWRRIGRVRWSRPDIGLEDLSQATGVSVETIAMLEQTCLLDPIALDFDRLAHDAGVSMEDALDMAADRGRLRAAMSVLTPRERTILGMKYGIGGDEEVVLAVAGKRLGISKERVRQIQKRSEERLREAMTE